MLTQSQIELIKATVPVLREAGVVLTTHFYKRMLTGNPELRNVFNVAHQARGEQQKALAGAVLAYAENIENPGVLLAAVKHIAAKHTTIGIRAEQYPIVGKHLLASIQEVLGEAATPELIDAWAAAYGQLADLLIQIENEMYVQQTTAEGGWSGWRPFVVEKRVDETAEISSFYLRPTDGGAVPRHEAGQFVSVRSFIRDKGIMQPRQYTISCPPAQEYLRISVKRVDAVGEIPAGAMSTHLHQNIHEGDVLEVSAPAGAFTLKSGNTPVVLLSAGVGITPMLSMLGAIADQTPERPVTFIHTARTHELFALRHEVRDQMARLSNARRVLFFTQQAHECACGCGRFGRLDAQALADLHLDPAADVYLCGPIPFMAEMKNALIAQGFKSEQIIYEVFGTGALG